MAKRAERPATAYGIFRQGHRFHSAVVALRNAEDRGELADPPMIVILTMCAFASELYLKALIHDRIGQHPRDTHNLRTLYLQLDLPTRKLLAKEWAAVHQHVADGIVINQTFGGQPLNIDLDDALKAQGGLFSRFRYIFEATDFLDTRGEVGMVPLILHLPDVLQSVLSRVKPDWVRL